MTLPVAQLTCSCSAWHFFTAVGCFCFFRDRSSRRFDSGGAGLGHCRRQVVCVVGLSEFLGRLWLQFVDEACDSPAQRPGRDGKLPEERSDFPRLVLDTLLALTSGLRVVSLLGFFGEALRQTPGLQRCLGSFAGRGVLIYCWRVCQLAERDGRVESCSENGRSINSSSAAAGWNAFEFACAGFILATQE